MNYSRPRNYRPDIDGLRAVAVLSVVGFHAEIGLLKGGFIGVDIFFVISGYLISGIILGALERGTFTFADFYIRRINRIFPALIVVLAAVLAVGWVILFPPEFLNLSKHTLAGALFSSNLLLWSEIGYFESHNKPLLHLWSLAVEEQFYLIWPATLLIIRRQRWNVFNACVALVGASFVFNLWLVSRGSLTGAFYSPLSRFWEILAGALLAVRVTRRSELGYGTGTTITNVIAIIGGVLIVLGLCISTPTTPWPGATALLPVGGTLLIIAAGPCAALNRLALSNRPMVGIGLISYPLYLWHWPILLFARIVNEGILPRSGRVALIIIAIGLAAVTYRLVEFPIRFGAKKRRSAIRLAAGMFGCVGLAFVVLVSRMSPMLGEEYNALVKDSNMTPGPSGYFGPGGEVKASVIPGDSLRTIVFLGDSHSAQYRPRMEYLAGLQPSDSFPQFDFLAYGGCSPIPGINKRGISWDGGPFRCHRFQEGALRYVMQPRVKVVVMSAFWETYFNSDEIFMVDDHQRRRIAFPGKEGDAVLNDLEREIAMISHAGKLVYIVLPTPKHEAFDPEKQLPRRLPGLSPRNFRGTVPVEEATAVSAELRKRLLKIAASTGAVAIDPLPLLCRKQVCPVIDSGGNPIYLDQHHLRPSFVRDEVTYLDGIVAAAMSNPMRSGSI